MRGVGLAPSRTRELPKPAGLAPIAPGSVRCPANKQEIQRNFGPAPAARRVWAGFALSQPRPG
jgi:hypothetical protein